MRAIGVDRDQPAFGRHVLTSVIRRLDVLFETLLDEVEAGRIRTRETTTLRLRDRGAELAPVSPKVPRSLRAALEQLRLRIVAGEIRVPGASYG